MLIEMGKPSHISVILGSKPTFSVMGNPMVTLRSSNMGILFNIIKNTTLSKRILISTVAMHASDGQQST
jgi:hypothetical protein